MTNTTSRHPDLAKEEFGALFRDLTDAWWSHQQLKASKAPLADLANSNARLFNSRMAMGAFHGRYRS